VADITADGFTRVAWITTIANIAAPTVAELNAGLLLHDVMTVDGFTGFNPDTAAVSTSKFSGRFDTNRPGRVSYSGTKLRLFKQTATDTAFIALPYGTDGFLAVRRDLITTTAWTSTQPLEIYPGTTGERVHVDPEPNSYHRWECPLFFNAQPNLNAVVA